MADFSNGGYDVARTLGKGLQQLVVTGALVAAGAVGLHFAAPENSQAFFGDYGYLVAPVVAALGSGVVNFLKNRNR